jgi:hypothetical protein
MHLKSARTLTVIALTVFFAHVSGCGRQPTTTPATPAKQERKPVEKFGVPVVAGPMDAVLLKDYAPDSSLKVPETQPAKARFPVIDVHAHVYAETPQEVAEWVRTMDEVGVELTVVLTEAVGKEFDRLVDLYLKLYRSNAQRLLNWQK